MDSNNSVKEMVQLRDFVRNSTNNAALYELLSEECLELGFWAAKTARVMRNDVPTPVSLMECFKNVDEEYNDVVNAAYAIGIHYPDIDKRIGKMRRWKERIEEFEEYKRGLNDTAYEAKS